MKFVKGMALAVCALLAAGGAATTLATSADAAATMPAAAITGDPNASNGTLTFYNLSGVVVNSGTNLKHLFDFALASSPPARTGINRAQIYFAFPDKTKPDSQEWFSTNASSGTLFPNSSYPAPLNTAVTPVAKASAVDTDLADLLPTTTQDHSAGYDGILQVRLYDTGPGKTQTINFWATDIYYDATAGTWQQVYPQVSGAAVTSTSLTATPSSTTTGKTVRLTATVSVSSAVGTVQFSEGSTNIGSPVAVTGGTASITTGALATGIHSFGATFVPTDPSAYTGSTGNATVLVRNPPPDKTSLSISKNVTVIYGKTTVVRGTLTDITTHKAISGATVVLYYRHATNKPYVKSVSAKSSSTGAVAHTVKPTSKTYFQWRYTATAAHAAAASAVQKVSVKQTVSIAATSARIKHGHTLKVWGKVAPGASGLRVTLQHLVGKRVYNGATVTTKRQKLPNGKVAVGYVFTLRLAKVGSYNYRVSRPGTAALLGAVSRTINLKAV